MVAKPKRNQYPDSFALDEHGIYHRDFDCEDPPAYHDRCARCRRLVCWCASYDDVTATNVEYVCVECSK